MKQFLIKLLDGIKLSDIPDEYREIFDKLNRTKALKIKLGNVKLDSKFRLGIVTISSKGVGYLDSLNEERSRDLVIEDFNLNTAHDGDLVLAKRLFSKRGAKAKVIEVLERAYVTTVGYVDKIENQIVVKNIKTELPITIAASQNALKEYPLKTVLKIDNESASIIEVLGDLDDPKVDEKISLGIYNKSEFFSMEAEDEAKAAGDRVDRSRYKSRVDLTNLAFCTIDPPDAKDFDDAIYFDMDEYALYVAIADVSEYVKEDTYLDKEAKARGFSIYFPHKSIPMLPRALSENICSLKPNVDRLAFTIKITLDRSSLKPIKEEIFESIIHSKRRFSYDEIDAFLEGDFSAKKDGDDKILEYLLPLQKLLLKVKKQRLANGCEFSSSDARMILDENQNLLGIKRELETPSHSLIEDAMLLANKAAAKMYKKGIFRTHGTPDLQKLDTLLNELEKIGVVSESFNDPYKTIRELQKRANEAGLRDEVDSLIIRTQKQALYTPEAEGGHFGLGFTTYTHFTSPIRRYSDLIVHRLIKAILKDDKDKVDYIVSNADVIAMRVSELERDSAKVAWDYMDRKYARWFDAHKDESFEVMVIDATNFPVVATSVGDIFGARVYIMGEDEFELFERVEVEVVEVSITSTKIVVKKI